MPHAAAGEHLDDGAHHDFFRMIEPAQSPVRLHDDHAEKFLRLVHGDVAELSGELGIEKRLDDAEGVDLRIVIDGECLERILGGVPGVHTPILHRGSAETLFERPLGGEEALERLARHDAQGFEVRALVEARHRHILETDRSQPGLDLFENRQRGSGIGH